MTVYFIGAGPGAADLITVRGHRLLSRCPVCLYAGSIMPEDLLAVCPPGARVIDSGPLTLDAIVGEIADAHAAGHDVARLHSGDPSIYSAVAEQCRRLDVLGIDYEIVPGVPAFAAAAAKYWPGQDPVALLKKYPDRWPLMHLKDPKKGVQGGSTPDAKPGDDVPVGSGQIDWPAVLKTAKATGVKRYYIEDESDKPLEQIPQSMKYLKSVRF